MNILLIEDTIKLAENIATVLQNNLYQVTVAHTQTEAQRAVADTTFDLIIMDLALPDGDGISLCSQLRKEGYEGSILMLTARVTIASRIQGLDSGADDYLTKPFDMNELLARIRALSRRTIPDKTAQVAVGDITIDTTTKQVWKSGNILPLSPTEYRLIEYFLTHRGTVCASMEIYESVWGNAQDTMFSDTLKVHLSRLRRKIGEAVIVTVPGFGYRMD